MHPTRVLRALLLALSLSLASCSPLRSGLHRAIRVASASALSLLLIANPTLLQAQAAEDSSAFIDSLATVLETKAIMKVVPGYVKEKAYDNARTNIKYCINQLRLQKALDSLVGSSVDFSEDGDAIDAAADASTRITNTAIQLDSTVYTLIFIPSEDGVLPASAQKYVKQIDDFYVTLDNDLGIMLKVADEKQLQQAGELADKIMKDAPPFLFKANGKKAVI